MDLGVRILRFRIEDAGLLKLLGMRRFRDHFLGVSCLSEAELIVVAKSFAEKPNLLDPRL